MTTEYATAPESAKLLKAALHTAFPAAKFSVRLSRGTGYGWCSVSWTDGPTYERVTDITNLYEGEGFDGSTDSTIHYRTMLPDGRQTGLRGINCSRDISASHARLCAAQVATYYGLTPIEIADRGHFWTTESKHDHDGEARNATGHNWGSLIHQAASDRSRFTFSQES